MNLKLRLLSVMVLSVSFAGCGPDDSVATVGEDELGDDVLDMGPVTTEAELSGTQTVFVNFGAVRICDGSGEDARANRSFAICGHFGVCGGCKDFAATSLDREAVLSKLRSYYAAYNVSFTATRPASGNYTMLIISPSSGPAHGVAALDCGNGSPNGIAFVYRTADSFFTNIAGGDRAHGVAKASVHELGHSFGLGHLGTGSSASVDHMDVWSRGTRFTTGTTSDSLNCVGGAGRTQNAPSLLTSAVGAKSTTTPPTGGSYPLPAAPTGCGAIQSGKGLSPGGSIKSCDGRFTLANQTDGNVVLYQGSRALWSTGTAGKGGYAFVMQTDGNLVLYTRAGTALWNSRTAGRSGAALSLQNDGNAVVYQAGLARWTSGTCCH